MRFLKVLLAIPTTIVLLYLMIWLRNSYYAETLERDWRVLNQPGKRLPVGYMIITKGDGSKHVGFFHWILGPYEYRDATTGELKWTE